QDREPADRRHGVRQPGDARRLRARPDALRHDARAQHPRALHRAQVPGAVRMTDATASLPRPVPQGGSLFTLDGRVKRRNAAEARFRAYGMTAIVLALTALVCLLSSDSAAGPPAFQHTTVTPPG